MTVGTFSEFRSGEISSSSPFLLQFTLVQLDPTAGNINYYLPPTPGLKGKVFIFKNTTSGTGNIGVVHADGSELIDGFATLDIGDERAAVLINDGVGNWHDVLTLPAASTSTAGVVLTDGNEAVTPPIVPALDANGQINVDHLQYKAGGATVDHTASFIDVVFAVAMPNANYRVSVTADATGLTNVFISGKQTTGFRINGTCSADKAVDWIAWPNHDPS